MHFDLHINCDNDAFAGEQLRYEIERVLRRTSEILVMSNISIGVTSDINGNNICRWRLRDDNTVASALEDPVIIVTGDAIDGLSFIGPFASHYEATNFCDSHGMPADWHIAGLAEGA